MRRYAQTVLLFLLGSTLLKIAWTGTYLRYVREVHLPLLVLAGLALLVVAAANVWRDLRAARLPDDGAVGGLRLDGFFGSERLRAALTAPTRALSAARPRRGAAQESDPLADLSEIDRDGSGRPDRSRALAAGRAAAEHEGRGEARGRASAAIDSPTAALEVVPTAEPRANEPLRPEPSTEAFIAFRAGGDIRTGGSSAADEDEKPGPAAGRTERRRARGGWALLVVAVALLVLSPPALGVFPAVRAGTVVTVGSAAGIPTGDPVPMSLADYVAHAAGGGQALAGRQVRLVGFVVAGPRGEPYLARLAVGCCAAGARPVKVGLTGGLPDVLTPDEWITVVGTYTDRTDPDPVNAAPIPYLSVVEVTEIDPPADPYES